MSLRHQLAVWNAAQQRAREAYYRHWCADCGKPLSPHNPGAGRCLDCGTKARKRARRARKR